MKFGLQEKVVGSINSMIRKFPQVEHVVLYGSRAKGNYRPNSDIDLCLIGETIDPDAVRQIEMKLDDLMLPYRIDVTVLH